MLDLIRRINSQSMFDIFLCHMSSTQVLTIWPPKPHRTKNLVRGQKPYEHISLMLQIQLELSQAKNMNWNLWMKNRWAPKKPWFFRVYRGWIPPTQIYGDHNKLLYTSWWLNHPSEIICSSNWIMKPQFSGWFFRKYLSYHHPDYKDPQIDSTHGLDHKISSNSSPRNGKYYQSSHAWGRRGVWMFHRFKKKTLIVYIVGGWATHLKKNIWFNWIISPKCHDLPKPTVGPHKTSRSPRRTTLRHLTAGNVRGLGTPGTVGSAKLSAQHFKLSLAQGECVRVLIAAINLCVCSSETKGPWKHANLTTFQFRCVEVGCCHIFLQWLWQSNHLASWPKSAAFGWGYCTCCSSSTFLKTPAPAALLQCDPLALSAWLEFMFGHTLGIGSNSRFCE